MNPPTAGVAETVEQVFSLTDSVQEEMVVLLIEEVSGFLSGPNIYPEAEPVLFYFYNAGWIAMEDLNFFFQTLQLANSHVVSGHDAAGCENFQQSRHDQFFSCLHSQGEKLHRQIVSIFIDNQSRQKIPFALDGPEALHPGVEGAAVAEGLFDQFPVKGLTVYVDVLRSEEHTSE